MSATKDTPKRLAIIDGKSVFYRGYYAMRDLSTKDGTPTGGVYGFAVMALEVLKKLKPDYVCVAWDKPKTNIRKRKELYPEYKAGRTPPPPDFYEQIPVLHELLDAFGWPMYEIDDYEADDIMGTFAVEASKQGIETQLITSDLDVLQLVNPLVHVYALKKGLSNIELFKPESLEKKYGIKANQFLDFKALKGDSSDNIPGVAGIGEKTATELLQEHGSLDGVYANLELIKNSVRKKLEAGKESAYLSKKIAAIWTDVPIPFDIRKMNGDDIDVQKIQSIFEKLEFRTLVRQLPDSMNGNGTFSTPALPANERIVPEKVQYIKSDDSLQKLELPETIYIQSRAKNAHGKQPYAITISVADKPTTYVIVLADISIEVLANCLSPVSSIIGHDTKANLQVLHELGLPLPKVNHDVFVAAFLLNPLRREQSLTELAQTEFAYEGSSFEDTTDKEFASRAGEVSALIKALHQQQKSSFQDIPKLPDLAKTIEWPVIPVLARMEHEGIQLDTAYLEKMSDELADDINDVEQEIYGYADKEFNVSSPKQLSEVLFEEMKLPTNGIKKGKTGYSTAANQLGKLRGQHPIIESILKYREYTKLKSTYVDTLPKLVDERSRVHTSFHLTIAQTGRLSSTDPNLQNIPVRTELGKRIRRAFVAAEGNKLISADYSQFELRLAAYLADDKELIGMFNDGADIHTTTAAQIYGRNPEDVTKTMRRDAKVINFGILYGMSPHGLVAATGMSYAAAKKFIDSYFTIRKPIMEYIESLKMQARDVGYVETLFGRRRPTPDIRSSNFIVRQAAERAAINMPIQGTEADIMKMAMVAVDDILPSSATQLLQIHDSILVECPADVAESVAKKMKYTMQNIYKLPVNLEVDVTIGSHWGEL
jgi:DNA polymerase-1